MNAYLVLPAGTDAVTPPATATTRAAQLGCELLIGDPTGLVTVYPSVVVTSPAISSQIIPDDTGQATLSEVQTAQSNATNAETTLAGDVAQNVLNIQNLLGTISTQVSQSNTDLATLAASVDPLAPILARVLQGLLGVTQAVASFGVVGGHLDPRTVPKI